MVMSNREWLADLTREVNDLKTLMSNLEEFIMRNVYLDVEILKAEIQEIKSHGL